MAIISAMSEPIASATARMRDFNTSNSFPGTIDGPAARGWCGLVLPLRADRHQEDGQRGEREGDPADLLQHSHAPPFRSRVWGGGRLEGIVREAQTTPSMDSTSRQRRPTSSRGNPPG